MIKKIVTFAKKVTLLLLTTCVLSTSNYSVITDNYAVSACSESPDYDYIIHNN